jgi:hypothetical protein
MYIQNSGSCAMHALGDFTHSHTAGTSASAPTSFCIHCGQQCTAGSVGQRFELPPHGLDKGSKVAVSVECGLQLLDAGHVWPALRHCTPGHTFLWHSMCYVACCPGTWPGTPSQLKPDACSPKLRASGTCPVRCIPDKCHVSSIASSCVCLLLRPGKWQAGAAGAKSMAVQRQQHAAARAPRLQIRCCRARARRARTRARARATISG